MGKALRPLLPEAVFLDRREADFANPAALQDLLESHCPDVVINAAAYTQVDNAESEENLAYIINAESPAAIAIYCSEKSIPLVHFSTDYVFDGSGSHARKENDSVNPLGAYGRTKLAGEDKIQQVGGKFLILRTSWLYDADGRNFFNTMLRLTSEREELRVVSDQVGAPTYVPQLARASLAALSSALKQEEFPSGIYHMCHGGETSWHAFAEAIAEGARARGIALKVKNIAAIASEEYPVPARRPLNSRLDCSKLRDLLGVQLPVWQEGLSACLEQKYARA